METHYRFLSMLRTIFPRFEDELGEIYWKDAVFREIAREYIECINKQEMIVEKTGKKSDVYDDTIKELEVELLSYLERMKSNN